MVLNFKNNSVYYKDYKLNNGMLSWFLIPFFIINIIFYKNYIKYFSYVSIAVAIIGIIETYYFYLKYKYFFIAIISIIFHLILLYPLINIDNYLKPNISNLILVIIGLFIIYFLPYWPYLISKNSIILLLLFSYLLTYTIYILNKTIKN
jgi:hypothetical protein